MQVSVQPAGHGGDDSPSIKQDSVVLSVPAEATAGTLLTDEPDDMWTQSQSLMMKPAVQERTADCRFQHNQQNCWQNSNITLL